MASSKLLFVGKTAIVTGASRGLGRKYALDLGLRGAKVLVNDISEAVEDVAEEIRTNGGFAVTCRKSCTDGSAIVEDAIKLLGGCDILVNNAGINVDRSFAKMTKDDWNSVVSVSLQGTFEICHAAWPTMKQNRYGRIINISSDAGLYGNFGQANYSAAKLGVFGLTNTLAIEGAKDNILANCVVPVALTDMTEGLIPPEVAQRIGPEHVCAIVSYLAHESCSVSGQLFEVGGGCFSRVRFQKSAGLSLGSENKPATAEDIAEHLTKIADFDTVTSSYPASVMESLKSLLSAPNVEKYLQKRTIGGQVTKASTALLNEDDGNASTLQMGALSSDDIFQKLLLHLQKIPESANMLALKIDARIRFNIFDSNNKCQRSWILDAKASSKNILSPVDVKAPDDEQLQVSIACSDQTFCALANGLTSPESAYMTGIMRIQGKMGIALRVKVLLELMSKM